jgi:hypothetical protein
VIAVAVADVAKEVITLHKVGPLTTLEGIVMEPFNACEGLQVAVEEDVVKVLLVNTRSAGNSMAPFLL